MNTKIVDFLRNVSDENIVAAKESLHGALAQKVGEALTNKEQEIRNSLYNGENKEN
jgi:hypothetical protein